MGQPEGAGCYCAANTLLSGFLERLSGNYPYVVMDNEAGMEHLSRLTTKNVDVLLIVTDTSRRGLQAGLRIHQLTKDLKLGIGKSYIVINQARSDPDDAVKALIQDNGLELAGVIPDDDQVYRFDLEGRPTIEIEDGNPALASAYSIFDRVVP
jgi:CO dehydrogenase maturation factor